LKRLAFLVLLAAWCLPMAAAPETWNNAVLLDTMCAAKDKVKADPDAHPRSCALQCRGGGYGILTSDGTFLKLDPAGNQQAAAALEHRSQKDHLRVTVSGERQGDTIKVQSLKL
jgi:hypothetical protein